MGWFDGGVTHAELAREPAARIRPAVPIVLGFAGIIGIGTVLLSLPAAAAAHRRTGLLDALFTSTSAVCVTGLISVDPRHWSRFGQVMILLLVQLGGIGIMTAASLLGLLIFHRFGLRMRLTTQAETQSPGLAGLRSLIVRVAGVSLSCELLFAVVLSLRLATGYDVTVGEAIYRGIFSSVSAFNNAGFALRGDSLARFAADGWIVVPTAVAMITGGLGFPVLLELLRRRLRHPRRWSLHTRLTLLGTAVLVVIGPVLITGFEWTNPATLGHAGVPRKLLDGFFTGVMPRSGGLSVIDIGSMHPASLLVQDILMFIGGGSAGTAGGIKITTFALLGFVILAEIRGEPTVHILGRRLPAEVQRQALAVALSAVGAIVVATLAVLLSSPFGLQPVLFEVVSAFATTGLSTGITGQLPLVGQLVLIVMMFVGRLGPITLASALALRERTRRFELPEERPIVG